MNNKDAADQDSSVKIINGKLVEQPIPEVPILQFMALSKRTNYPNIFNMDPQGMLYREVSQIRDIAEEYETTNCTGIFINYHTLGGKSVLSLGTAAHCIYNKDELESAVITSSISWLVLKSR